jgi:hypothetical protein
MSYSSEEQQFSDDSCGDDSCGDDSCGDQEQQFSFSDQILLDFMNKEELQKYSTWKEKYEKEVRRKRIMNGKEDILSTYWYEVRIRDMKESWNEVPKYIKVLVTRKWKEKRKS